mgnify:CR=1 FL=1
MTPKVFTGALFRAFYNVIRATKINNFSETSFYLILI